MSFRVWQQSGSIWLLMTGAPLRRWYAQCLTPERAAKNVEQEGWAGTVMHCGEPMA